MGTWPTVLGVGVSVRALDDEYIELLPPLVGMVRDGAAVRVTVPKPPAYGVVILKTTDEGAFQHSVTTTPGPEPACPAGRLLPNGICLSWTTPPRRQLDPLTAAEPPPYIREPPAVVNITSGRQLFIDTFLVEVSQTRNVVWEWHPASYDTAHNPVLRPDRPWELCPPGANQTYENCRTVSGDSQPPGSPLVSDAKDGTYKHGFASVFSGGVWYDPADKLYKMYYSCAQVTCVAFSDDAHNWRKPSFNHTAAVQPGTNIVAMDFHDGNTVWLDLESADPSAKWKMASVPEYTRKLPGADGGRYMMYNFYSSADGINFKLRQNHSGYVFDRSTMFYNPFRQKCIYRPNF